MKKLSPESLIFSRKHLLKDSDTDLLPRPFEIGVIERQWEELSRFLDTIDLASHQWGAFRRFLVPKDEFSFRVAVQLDPLDSLVFTAIIKEIGEAIEKRRIPATEEVVFSNRFLGDEESGNLYRQDNMWESFWIKSLEHAKRHKWVVITDVSDFYNQIYHHSLENQLAECGLQKEYVRSILALMKHVTQGVSRGIPVGPHGSHLLSELAMVPIDNFMKLKGYTFCRYVDDIHVFCDSREQGQIAIFELANVFNQNHRMILNRQKTDVLPSANFMAKAMEMTTDDPINDVERAILSAIKARTAGPYHQAKIDDFDIKEKDLFSKESLETVLTDYLSSTSPDYPRLRWFLRRLSQVGAPGAIDFILGHFREFLPAVADTVNYFKSTQNNYEGAWLGVGKELLDVLGLKIVRQSEYLQIVILSLFGRIDGIDHIEQLIRDYGTCGSGARRKIVLAAGMARAADWLRTFKDEIVSLDPWLRRAVLHASATLPKDERDYWWRMVRRKATVLERAITSDAGN